MRDNIAIAFGSLCLLHCLLVPLLLAIGTLSTLIPWLDSQQIHQLLLIPVMVLALLSLPFSYIRHGAYRPMLFAAAGIAAMFSSVYLPEAIEVWITVPSVLLVIWAHLSNKWLLRRSRVNQLEQVNG